MPTFEAVTDLRCPPEAVYDFLIRPANALLVTPTELKATLVEGPEVLTVGSRVTVRVWKYGVSQTLTTVITALEPARLMRDEQPANGGPFRKFAHTHALEVTPDGCRMLDRVEFEPPGGLLGMVVTEKVIVSELRSMFAYRDRRFRELLAGG